jgi:hypothetical protein
VTPRRLSVAVACGASLAYGASLACAALLSCSGEPASSAAEVLEPIRVEGAQFIAGPLPGSPEPPASADAGPAATPTVTDVQVQTNTIAPGLQGLDFGGHASPSAQTVAVRFADLGTGYWVVPVGVPDPSANNALTWQFTADFGHDIAPGPHALLFAAVDGNGASGTQSSLPFCVDTPVPDNHNACSPKIAPPAAVLSLTWNTAVDLDLIVRTPSGAVVGGKQVTTAPPGSSIKAASGGSNGVLDHDSNRNCVIDGIQREDIVWQATPAAGLYEVWVDLYRACGQPAASFDVSLWLPESNADGGKRLIEQPRLAAGELLAAQANGGTGPGLFVGSFNFQ